MPPKRKKRFHGLYYHSSPPRVLPMNAQAPVETKKKSADDFSIRLSTIRIWMHEKDIGKLTRVLWAGQGNRLRQQASTNPKVKRFLAAVPYVMNSIKDVHQSVVDNSLETLQATMESNVPPTLITCKDANGLNVIHKAAGLGHTMMLEYLLSIWPDGAHETDMTGKTALHWAASAKNNMRCYTLLTQAGCEEDALDYKMKTPLYYKQKHNEIERSFLTQVPEAPRVSQDIPVDWEALASDDSDDKKKPEIIIPNGRRKSDVLGNSVNLLTSRSEANSIENTSEPDLFQGDNANEEDHSEAPPEESESTDDLRQPLENGHAMNSEVDISESDPASPPKTPEETQNENEVENVEEQPEKLSEDENVGNTLNDQNNNDENAVNEAEQKESDSNGENSGEEEIDVDDDHKEAEHKEIESNGKNSGEEENDADEDHKESEKEETKEEEIKESDKQNEDHTNQEEKDVEKENGVKKESEDEEDNKHNDDIDKNGIENKEEEKTDVTDSIKDNNETHNDNRTPKEQINSGEEKVITEPEEVPTAEEITKNFEKEDDDENKSSSPLTEKTQVDDIKSEDNQAEKDQSEDRQSEAASPDEQPLVETLKTASQPETQLKEQQPQEQSSSQTPLEQSSSEELESENSQPERPESKKSRTGSSHSNNSHSNKEANTNQIKSKKNIDSKNEESNEKHKDTDDEDDDDDDQVQFGSL